MTARQAANPALLTSLFHEAWWLEAASGGDWAEATVRENGRVIARLPYVVKNAAGLVGLGMPPLTRTLGPQFIFDEASGQPQGNYRRLVTELVEQLPKHAYFTQICDPRFTHTLPFYGLGFDSTLSFTMRIPPEETAEARSLRQRKQLRYDIKRAGQQFSVDPAIGSDEFCHLHNKWLKKNHNVWWSRSYEERADSTKLRLFRACEARGCVAILGARDGQGNLRATIALVWGHGVMYYWISGRDPDPEAAGAVKLLIAQAVELAAAKGLIFDFDGFPRPNSVSMLAGFGGEVTNRITVSKTSLRARMAREIGSRLRFAF